MIFNTLIPSFEKFVTLTDPTSSTKAKTIPCDELGKQIDIPIVSKVYATPFVTDIITSTIQVLPIK